MTEILQIVEIPNPILAEKSKPVQVVDDNVRKIMDSMLATMYKCNGVGLAAVQVGILKRIVVIDIGDDPNNNVKMPLYMVNPEIISSSDEKNEFEDVEEAAYFLNPFGTLRIECIYSFALTMKATTSMMKMKRMNF